MMIRAFISSTIFLCLAACATPAPESVGYLPVDAFGNSVQGQDMTVAATNEASIAFAYPKRMQGEPARMALAIASLDALAGQFGNAGRWPGGGGTAAMQLLNARSQVRAILGVPADTQSQSLIDHLLAASHALDDGDTQAALAALSGPDFSTPPEQVLATLGHFPYVASANSALMAASDAEFPQDGSGLNM